MAVPINFNQSIQIQYHFKPFPISSSFNSDRFQCQFQSVPDEFQCRFHSIHAVPVSSPTNSNQFQCHAHSLPVSIPTSSSVKSIQPPTIPSVSTIQHHSISFGFIHNQRIPMSIPCRSSQCQCQFQSAPIETQSVPVSIPLATRRMTVYMQYFKNLCCLQWLWRPRSILTRHLRWEGFEFLLSQGLRPDGVNCDPLFTMMFEAQAHVQRYL